VDGVLVLLLLHLRNVDGVLVLHLNHLFFLLLLRSVDGVLVFLLNHLRILQRNLLGVVDQEFISLLLLLRHQLP